MRTDSISPRECRDGTDTLLATLQEIAREMEAEHVVLAAVVLASATTQIHDRSALLVGPASKTPPHCGNCKSFRTEDSECRRYAPFLRGLPNKLVTAWPNVSATDYCGEHAL